MPEIEYLLMADHVEAVNGKLYVMGGGWTHVSRPAPDPSGAVPTTHFGVGVSVLVPWTETNRPHRLSLTIETEDGDPIAPPVEVDLEMGRPPGLRDGSDQRAVLALNADVAFPQAGGYRVRAAIEDEARSTSFEVADA